MEQEPNEGDDFDVKSEILEIAIEEEDESSEEHTLEQTRRSSSPLTSMQQSTSVELPKSFTVIPPIQDFKGRREIETQTDICLFQLPKENISSFRPSKYMPEEGAGLQQSLVPVIETTSAPALLKTSNRVVEPVSKTETIDTKLAARSLDSLTNEESRSDLNPSEEESVTSYSAISELDGVGPPTILQYIKESTRVKRNVPAPKPLSERFPMVNPSVERSNMCPFCHTELLPVPPLSDASDDEDDDKDKKPSSPAYNIKDADGGETPTQSPRTQLATTRAAAADNDEDKIPTDGYLYCCEDYYWHLINKNRMERRDSFYQEGEAMEVKKIDVSPHAPFGSKQARKLAKDRANESTSVAEKPKKKKPVKPKPRLTPLHQLVRERELEKVRPVGGPPRAGGGATTLFSYARQMKTINFALSSRKCMEDGWTVTNYQPPPESPQPVLYDTVDETQMHPLPGLNVPWQQNSEEFHRHYRNGTVFLTLLPDGTGMCYYPSGAPAVVITLEQPGIYTYYVLSDSDTSARLLAVCSQLGRIAVFHENGKIKYQCSPIEGNLFNDGEVRTKHWEWDAFAPHVHAPPFQPVYFQISPYFSLRCVSLEQQTLVFNYKRYTFKCSVGSRTKKLQAKPLEQPQLLKFLSELDDTRARISDNLRILNSCINSNHKPTQRNLESRSTTSPRKSYASNRTTVTAS